MKGLSPPSKNIGGAIAPPAPPVPTPMPIIILVEAEPQSLTSMPTEDQTACIGDYRNPLYTLCNTA